MALGSNTGIGFLCTNDLQSAQKGEFSVWIFGFLVKTVRIGGLQAENKLKKNKKNNKRDLLEVSVYWLRILGQLRVSRVISSRWGG